ncbi:hypothetical protein VTO42DRAFT_1173 [Malbranchea cinnamomea]
MYGPDSFLHTVYDRPRNVCPVDTLVATASRNTMDYLLVCDFFHRTKKPLTPHLIKISSSSFADVPLHHPPLLHAFSYINNGVIRFEYPSLSFSPLRISSTLNNALTTACSISTTIFTIAVECNSFSPKSKTFSHLYISSYF